MSQDDILTWLEEHPGWHPAKNVIESIQMAPNAVYDCFRRMRKNKKVDYKAGDHGIWLYRVDQ